MKFIILICFLLILNAVYALETISVFKKESLKNYEGVSKTGPFRKMFHEGDLNWKETDSDPGEPLFLSQYIKNGQIEEGRKRSRVSMGHRHGHSYSGFITVNEKYESNMFFWFFPARKNEKNSPLVVWLQGGPGGSSLFGLFAENGPFSVNKDDNLVPRNYSWNANHNVLYIDNPVGTGFSFTKFSAGYAKNENDVGENLYSFMTQFFTVYDSFLDNPLYITGESYAGKYVPALTYFIHKNNPSAAVKMNLKGMAIGNGLCDPITMIDYGDFLYQIGLIDSNWQKYYKDQAKLAVKYITNKKWKKAFQIFDELLNGDFSNTSTFYNLTGLKNYYNYLEQTEPEELNYWTTFINLGKIRQEIHVGNLTFNDGVMVEKMLMNDIMQSVKPWIEELLKVKSDKYKVLLYNGQLDIIVAAPLTDAFVNTLDFQYADRLKKSQRLIWRVGSDVAGYVKEVPNFAQVVVRDSGHLVPYDQPKWAFDMITRFTSGNSFFN